MMVDPVVNFVMISFKLSTVFRREHYLEQQLSASNERQIYYEITQSRD
jgi:hypothetical protein